MANPAECSILTAVIGLAGFAAMTLALKRSQPEDNRKRPPGHHRTAQRRPQRRSPGLSKQVPLRLVPEQRSLHSLPQVPEQPWTIRGLGLLHAATAWVLGAAALSTVGVYGYSVLVDRQLQAAHHRLEKLGRSQQELTTASEALKHHLAQEAETPRVGFTLPHPDEVIFVAPAPVRNAQTVKPAATSLPRPPLGY